MLSLDFSTGRFQHFTTGFDDIGVGTWTIEAGTLTLNYEEGDDFFISGVIVFTASLSGQTLTLTQKCDDIFAGRCGQSGGDCGGMPVEPDEHLYQVIRSQYRAFT